MHRIIDHRRLIEAVGLLLVLVAWSCDWRGVQKFDLMRDEFNSHLTTMLTHYGFSVTLRDISIEASVTRALIDEGGSDGDSAYKIGWEHPEMRTLWFRRFLIRYELLKNISSYIRDFSSDATPWRVSKLDSSDTLIHAVADSVAGFGATGSRPDPRRLDFDRAIQMDRKLGEIHTRLLREAQSVSDAMRQNRSKAARLYKWLFAFGSICLISGKFLEWREDRSSWL